MRIPISLGLLLSLSLAAVLAGCARPAPVPSWHAGRAAELTRALADDSTLLRQERWLFESGLSHAVPQSAAYDPELARERLERLLELHPRSRHAPTVRYLLPLLAESSRRRAEAQALREEVDRLREEVAAHRERVEALTRALQESGLREDRHLAAIAELQARVQGRELAIRELEEKLEALMRIDLQPRS